MNRVVNNFKYMTVLIFFLRALSYQAHLIDSLEPEDPRSISPKTLIKFLLLAAKGYHMSLISTNISKICLLLMVLTKILWGV